MTAESDPVLVAAFAVLDEACDTRSIIADISEAAVRGPDGVGVFGMEIKLSPIVGNARPGVVRVPYNDRTGEFLRALAARVLAARSWNPGEWATQAVADVLGTQDAPAHEVAATAELPEGEPE